MLLFIFTPVYLVRHIIHDFPDHCTNIYIFLFYVNVCL